MLIFYPTYWMSCQDLYWTIFMRRKECSKRPDPSCWESLFLFQFLEYQLHDFRDYGPDFIAQFKRP